jgi:hypothetical protein
MANLALDASSWVVSHRTPQMEAFWMDVLQSAFAIARGHEQRFNAFLPADATDYGQTFCILTHQYQCKMEKEKEREKGRIKFPWKWH